MNIPVNKAKAAGAGPAAPQFIFCLIVLLVLPLLSSCASKTRTALPAQYSGKAQVPGMPVVRDFGGRHSAYYQKDFEQSLRQFSNANPGGLTAGNRTMNILALSGGGSNGAFGAGLLNGWDASDTKPTFAVVTSISTGALIAPFAFLGGEYDVEIGRLFTSVHTEDVYTNKSFFGMIGSVLGSSDSLTDSKPLQDLLEQYIDEEMLKKIAEAHNQGRRLLIATTNLDARKLVVWNMGAIAASGRPDAPELFRKVVLASASMPLAFPAVYIEVEADGRKYDEMHVDGGVMSEVFFFEDIFDVEEGLEHLGIEKKPEVKLYIIRNSQIEPQYQEVKIDLLSIAGRSISSLTSTQGVGDLYRIYLLSEREGIDFNLASIPPDFVPNAQEDFDPVEMKRLYDLGYDMAKSGYPWEKYPPMYHE
jgi:predicted patatin/cPLA2 family phospholipase